MGDTGRTLGGGEVSAFEGSFSHDDIQYRVRSIVGAAGIDNSAVAVSLGDGTPTGGGSFAAPITISSAPAPVAPVTPVTEKTEVKTTATKPNTAK
jgi:hypothetical protein